MNPLRKTDRQTLFDKQQAYYDGNPTPQLRTRANQVNDNLPLPIARITVDKGAAFLFGRDVRSQIEDPPSEGPQEWLDEAWRRNKRGILLQKLATNGGMFGQAFVRVLDNKPYPRVIVLDPKTVEVKCDPDDCDDVWSYTITQPQPEDADGDEQQGIYRRTLIENRNAQPGYLDDSADPNWVIEDQEYRGEQGTGGAWVSVRQQDWPYPFAPITGCQNLPRPNSYWGESDIPQDILSLIDGINRVSSHWNKLTRLFAHPKLWTRGMGAQRLDMSTDSVIHLPSETAELKALELRADMASVRGLLEQLLALNAYAVRIPLIAMGQPDGAGSLSGVAVQLRFQPLLEKTEAKRQTYGDLLKEVDHCLLVMGGFGPDMMTQIVWPELLPKDPIQEREAMILEDQLALVSKQTMAETLGYDYDEEQRRRADEAQQAVDAMPMPLIPGQRADNVTPQDHPVMVQPPQGPDAALQMARPALNGTVRGPTEP